MIAHKEYGSNMREIVIGDVTLYFSYSACIAFHTPFRRMRNPAYVKYSSTTSKHATQMGCNFEPAVNETVFHNSLVDALGDLPHLPAPR